MPNSKQTEYDLGSLDVCISCYIFCIFFAICESASLPFASECQRKKKVSRQVVLFNDELRFDEKIDLRNQSQQQTLSESNFERLRAKLTNSPVVSNAVGNSAAPSQIKQILQVYSSLHHYKFNLSNSQDQF